MPKLTEQEQQEAFNIAKDVVALGVDAATKVPKYCLEKVSQALIDLVTTGSNSPSSPDTQKI